MFTCCDVVLGRLWNSVFLSVSREARNRTRLALPMEMKITLKQQKKAIYSMASGSGKHPGVAVSVNVGFILLI